MNATVQWRSVPDNDLDYSHHKNVYIVDDSSIVRRSTYALLNVCGYHPRSYLSGADFLADLDTLKPGCVLLDLQMPGPDGMAVLEATEHFRKSFPIIVITGHGDVGAAVKAMKLGAADFIEKPYQEQLLLDALTLAFEHIETISVAGRRQSKAQQLLDQLSDRENDVLRGLVAGYSSRVIATHLNISARTVEMHRANLTRRMGMDNLSDVLRVAFDGGIEPLS